jgi:hypothetical protein
MPIKVVGPHAHQRHSRVDRTKQLGVLIGRTVVGHLEHIGPQQRAVDLAEQYMLLLDFGVTGQEHSYAAVNCPHDHTVVVGIGAGAGQRSRRPQHEQIETTMGVRPAGHSLQHRRVSRACSIADEPLTGCRLPKR